MRNGEVHWEYTPLVLKWHKNQSNNQWRLLSIIRLKFVLFFKICEIKKIYINKCFPVSNRLWNTTPMTCSKMFQRKLSKGRWHLLKQEIQNYNYLFYSRVHVTWKTTFIKINHFKTKPTNSSLETRNCIKKCLVIQCKINNSFLGKCIQHFDNWQ